jgi:hypothetical protein
MAAPRLKLSGDVASLLRPAAGQVVEPEAQAFELALVGGCKRGFLDLALGRGEETVNSHHGPR